MHSQPIKIWLICCCLLAIASGQYSWCNLTATSQYAAATTSHSLVCTLQNYTIATTASYFTLAYSSSWGLGSFTRSAAADFCETGCTLSSVTVVPTGNTLRITGLLPNAITQEYVSFRYTINNIVNPIFSTTQTITFTLSNSGGTTLETHTLSMTIYPALMTCTGSPAVTTVSSSSAYTFTVTPSVALPSDGFMRMTFPAVWTNSLSGPAFSYSSCAGGVICIVSSNVVTASNLIASTSSSPFSFTFNSITNPGTQQPNSDLIFTYFYSNSSTLASCAVIISGLTSPALTNVSFTLSNNIITLSYTNTLLPLTTDELVITMPAEIALTNFTLAQVYIGNSITPLGVNPRIITDTNQISISPYASSIITSVQIFLSSIYFIYPATTSTIAVSLRRATYQYSYATCPALTLASSQTLSLTPVLSSYLLRSVADYTLTFSPTYHGIYKMLVNFGSAYALTPAATYPCYLATLTTSSQMVCTAQSTTQLQVTLTNSSASFSSYLGYATNYSLVIIGLTNPSQLTATVQLATYYLPSTQLEYSSIQTITFTPARIISASITCSSYQVGASSSYTFIINNTNSLLPSSQLNIYFPSIYSLTGYSCTVNSVAATCVNSANNTYVALTLPAIAYAPYSLPTQTITVAGLVNPPSRRPTSSFSLALESGGAVVEAINDGVVVIMTTLATFTSLTITPSSLLVGALASYTISFTHSLTISASSVITLNFQLPSSTRLVSCSACTSYSTFTITTATTSVTISSVYNPEQITEASPVVVSLYVDGYLSIQDSYTLPTFTSQVPAWTLATNSTFLGEPATVNLTFPYLALSTHTIVISIPAAYTLGTLSAYSDGSLTFTYAQANPTLTLTITSISAANATVVVQGITNPTVATSTAWQVSYYTASSILIGSQSSLNVFNAVCGTTCRDCVNTTYCLSCYSSPFLLTLLDTSTHLCVAACGSSQFKQANSCYPCNSTCLTCDLFAGNCTSCSPGFLLAGSCVTLCPDYYFGSTNVCTACSNNCKACSSAILCLSCANGFLLQNNATCLSTCPATQFNFSNVCSPCPTNCQTCGVSGCVTCTATFYLTPFTYATCVSSCPTGTYISASSCLVCNSNCASCFGTATNCTACSGGLLLSSNACVGTCPGTTYADELSQCKSCLAPCLGCTSLTVCTSCQPGYLFYAAVGGCVLTCFANTVNVGSTCVACTSPCLTCSIAPANCTSCIESYFLLNNACTPNCSAPYIATNAKCSLCYSPCVTCVSANKTNCSSCETGYFLFAFACYSSCPPRTYSDSASTCASCTPPCYTCSGGPNTCTGCFNGSYLFSNACYSPCPPTYFQNNGTCQLCQSQCTSCTYGTSYQCSACSSAVYFYNPITYACTASCTVPYYPAPGSSQICEPCRLPCKSCLTSSTTCGACYAGYFLKSQSCVTSCGSGFYEDGTASLCVACTSPCATCDAQKCFTCDAGTYYYNAQCYVSCPPAASNIYGIYCRNCIQDNCIGCNSQGLCIICLPTYYNYQGQCLSQCPSDYEPDLVTGTQCILRSDIAYFNYIKRLQHSKIWAVPASALLILSLPLLAFTNLPLFSLAFALALPQSLALVQLAINYSREWANLKVASPFWLVLAAIGMQIVSSFVYTILVKRKLEGEDSFNKLIAFGNNSYRVTIVTIFSAFNRQSIFLLFSGMFQLPFTSFHLPVSRSFYVIHCLCTLPQIVICALGLIICWYEGTYDYNKKLFYSAVDTLVVYAFSVMFQVFFLSLLSRQPAPPSYERFILPNVSNRSLPAYSEYREDAEEEQKYNNLHRSNSDEGLAESNEMKAVQFMSVIDPDDYFDETPMMNLDKVEQGLEKGDFRKKNKRKRGQRRDGKLRLDVIEEEYEDQEDNEGKAGGKKGKRGGKKQDIGGLKNYLYFKKPKAKKANPVQIFLQNENQIMSRIRQKEQQFDSITNNDIIFQDFHQSSSSQSQSGYNIQEESRRALHKPNYDNLFNLNYASKKHLSPN